MSIGTKLLPESPILRSSLSITKATLAIYPVSSSMDRKKNKVTIIGKKLRTLPTPAKIPSMIRLCTTRLIPYASKPDSTKTVSSEIAIASISERKVPITPKVSQKTANIIPIKSGIARYLFVKTLSILTLRICSLLSGIFVTVSAQTFSIKV